MISRTSAPPRRCSQGGFTLIEIVLVIALISIVAGFGLRLPYAFDPSRSAENDVFTVRAALHRAASFAVAGRGGSAWGVKVASGRTTVFRGDAYASRDPDADIVMTLDASPELAGSDEVVFASLTGSPSHAATVSLSFDGRTVDITVSRYGILNTTIHE